MPLAWSMRLLPRLPIHSRCYLARRWTPHTPPPPREPLQLVPRAEKSRPSRGPTRGALLTYRLPPISYTRNIANRITDARARPRPNEIAFAYRTDCPVPRVKDLARPWTRVRVPLPGQDGPANGASTGGFVITQGRSEEFPVTFRRSDKTESAPTAARLIKSLAISRLRACLRCGPRYWSRRLRARINLEITDSPPIQDLNSSQLGREIATYQRVILIIVDKRKDFVFTRNAIKRFRERHGFRNFV